MTEVPGDAKPSVVLVDDSIELRALVRRRLESSGHFTVVGEGSDGDEAISLSIRHQPDLLLLDTSMPTCDGIQALPAIVAVCPETAVVMFTGFHEQGLVARARELGAADYVEKSLPLEELPERLMRILSHNPRASSGERNRLSLVRGGAENLGEVSDEQSMLNEHVAQFQEAFDQAAIGMATMTVSGTIVRANTALARLMSCAPYDLLGVDYGRLMGGQGDKLDRGLDSITSSGRDLVTMEHPLPVAPGKHSAPVVRVTLAPIRDPQRRVLYVFAQVQDISALRAAEGDLRMTEEYFRLLVAAVGEYAIFMLDTEGNVVSWNSGGQRIKGYAPTEIIGRSFQVFYTPEERATGHPERNLEMARRAGRFAEEGWRVRKDGSRFWASVVISPVYDDSGRQVGFAKVTRDQTTQREHEEERQHSVVQQTHLLAVTAHELRTPTAVIEGSADELKTGWDEASAENRNELLANIHSSAHRLRRLASDLATASQLHSGTLQYQLEKVSLAAILHASVARRQAAEHDVPIETDIPREVTVNADPERLAQAVDNLLDNAFRHSGPPIRISVDIDEVVSIRVTDGGAGIPAQLVPRLFERFAMAGPRGGTGLGLYLVRQIAQAHGGDVEYHPPHAGRPTEFEVQLPRTS